MALNSFSGRDNRKAPETTTALDSSSAADVPSLPLNNYSKNPGDLNIGQRGGHRQYVRLDDGVAKRYPITGMQKRHPIASRHLIGYAQTASGVPEL